MMPSPKIILTLFVQTTQSTDVVVTVLYNYRSSAATFINSPQCFKCFAGFDGYNYYYIFLLWLQLLLYVSGRKVRVVRMCIIVTTVVLCSMYTVGYLSVPCSPPMLWICTAAARLGGRAILVLLLPELGLLQVRSLYYYDHYHSLTHEHVFGHPKNNLVDMFIIFHQIFIIMKPPHVFVTVRQRYENNHKEWKKRQW